MEQFQVRTDLALEARERFEEDAEIRGVSVEELYDEKRDLRLTKVFIESENGAKAMGKPVGVYITLEAPKLSEEDKDYHREVSETLADCLRELLGTGKERSVLIVGLGNREVTPDALGPEVVGNLRITRHLVREYGSAAFGTERVHLISGIVPGVMFDFSKQHILKAVEGSLRRLRTDYLDILLLHRPDALAEPEEVAAAFDELEQSGKVRAFGVSNMHPYQIELLQSCVRRPICVNQLQFSPAHAGMITAGLEANMRTEGAASHDGYVLDYCRLHGIAIQAWSPLRYGLLEGVYLDDPRFASLNACLARIAGERGVAKSAIVAAWILRHPAAMQVVTGTSNARRLLEMAEGAQIELSRAEWYEIYLSAGNRLP